jgi:hypothetical protein
MLLMLLGTVIEAKEEQPLQKPYGMAIAPLGMTREVNFEQPKRVKLPIVSGPLPNVKDVSLVKA